jgi:hypothetical protein
MMMKIFPDRPSVGNAKELFERTQSQLREVGESRPQELVAVKSRMGGYVIQRQEIPRTEDYLLEK